MCVCIINGHTIHIRSIYVCVCVYNQWLFIYKKYIYVYMYDFKYLSPQWRLATDDWRLYTFPEITRLEGFFPLSRRQSTPHQWSLRTIRNHSITPSLHHSTHCRSRSIFILGIHQDKRWPGSKGARGQGAKVITDQRIHRLTWSGTMTFSVYRKMDMEIPLPWLEGK